MKACPKCNKEFNDDVLVCPDCNVKLEPVEVVENWVTVYTTDNIQEAEMLKSNLSGANITCVILNEKDSSFPSPGDTSVIKITVNPTDFEDAKKIIDDINSRAD